MLALQPQSSSRANGLAGREGGEGREQAWPAGFLLGQPDLDQNTGI